MCAFFIDSRGALDSLGNRKHVFGGTVMESKNIIYDLNWTGRKVTFSWLPSHVAVFYKERVDELPESATTKDYIDCEDSKTLKQIKTKVKKA